MNALFEKIKNTPLIQSGLIVALCLVIYWLGPISSWETNDDVAFNLLFSGQLLTSAPEPHAVYINFVLSSLFTHLYTVAPGVPWYGYFHVTTILLSVWFLNYCYALARGNDNFFTRIILSLASALFLLFLLQFTKTAAVMAVAGYLGLYLLNQVTFPSLRQNLIVHACAVLLLVFSFALRRDSFFLITLLCGVLMASALLQRKRMLLVALTTAVVLILAVTLVHELNYGDEWQDFHALGRATRPIIDYNQYSYEENQKVYADVGFSRNDYNFLMNWGYADARVYSPERLGRIIANGIKIPRQSDPVAALQQAVSFPAQHYILIAGGLAFLFLFVYRQQYRFLFLSVLLPFLICTGIVAWQGRFPSRVSTTMFFFLPWAVLVLCGEMRKRLFVGVIWFVVLLALAVPIYDQYQALSSFGRYRLAQNKELRRLGAALSPSPVVLVILGVAFSYEGLLPFESPSYLTGNRIIWLAGMNQSPLQKKQLAENRIDDLFATLLSSGTPAYLIFDPDIIRILKQYYYEHYQKNVNFIPVFSGKFFTVCRLEASSL